MKHEDTLIHTQIHCVPHHAPRKPHLRFPKSTATSPPRASGPPRSSPSPSSSATTSSSAPPPSTTPASSASPLAPATRSPRSAASASTTSPASRSSSPRRSSAAPIRTTSRSSTACSTSPSPRGSTRRCLPPRWSAWSGLAARALFSWRSLGRMRWGRLLDYLGIRGLLGGVMFLTGMRMASVLLRTRENSSWFIALLILLFSYFFLCMYIFSV